MPTGTASADVSWPGMGSLTDTMATAGPRAEVATTARVADRSTGWNGVPGTGRARRDRNVDVALARGNRRLRAGHRRDRRIDDRQRDREIRSGGLRNREAHGLRRAACEAETVGAAVSPPDTVTALLGARDLDVQRVSRAGDDRQRWNADAVGGTL